MCFLATSSQVRLVKCLRRQHSICEPFLGLQNFVQHPCSCSSFIDPVTRLYDRVAALLPPFAHCPFRTCGPRHRKCPSSITATSPLPARFGCQRTEIFKYRVKRRYANEHYALATMPLSKYPQVNFSKPGCRVAALSEVVWRLAIARTAALP